MCLLNNKCRNYLSNEKMNEELMRTQTWILQLYYEKQIPK